MPVLARGKFHIEPLSGFPGEKPDGAVMAVPKLGNILATRLRNAPKPRIVETDRGVGFVSTPTG